jgi:hypothetical protein
LFPSGTSGYRADPNPETATTRLSTSENSDQDDGADRNSATLIPDGQESFDIGDITLVRLQTLSGTVHDDSGHPVAGARVTASWNEPHSINPQWLIDRVNHRTSAVDGSFEIPGIDPNADVVLAADRDGAVMERLVTVGSKQLGQPVSLKISRTAAIRVRGRVTDQSGNGISGVPVVIRHRWMTPPTDPEQSFGSDVEGGLVTDSSGAFSTTASLSPWGEYIAVVRPGTKREVASDWTSAVPGQPLELPPIVDSRTSQVTGRVLTWTGVPLANARVSLLTSSAESESLTDQDGQFTIERLPGRLPLLIAEADGFLTNGLGVGEASIELRLPRESDLTAPHSTAPGQVPDPNSAWSAGKKREVALRLAEEISQSADEHAQARLEAAIARYAPDHTLKRLKSLPSAQRQSRQMIRVSLAMGLASDRPQEGLRILEELPDGPMRLFSLIPFERTAKLTDDERLQLLARLVQDARAIQEAQFRVAVIGQVGERLLDLGQRESGEALLREGFEDAKKLAPAAWSGFARGAFAEEFAQVDADAALEVLEPLTDASEFNRHMTNTAHELAAIDPDRASPSSIACASPLRNAVASPTNAIWRPCVYVTG